LLTRSSRSHCPTWDPLHQACGRARPIRNPINVHVSRES
jgi:hypothetical protein